MPFYPITSASVFLWALVGKLCRRRERSHRGRLDISELPAKPKEIQLQEYTNVYIDSDMQYVSGSSVSFQEVLSHPSPREAITMLAFRIEVFGSAFADRPAPGQARAAISSALATQGRPKQPFRVL